MNLLITASGTVRCVYDETVDLSAIGTLSIQHRLHAGELGGDVLS